MLSFGESLNNHYLCEAGMCCRFGNLLKITNCVRLACAVILGNLLTITICVRLACCAVIFGISLQ